MKFGTLLPERIAKSAVPWLFLAPALIAFTWFKFIPMLSGLKMSFYKVNFGAPNEWVGFANFERVLADAGLRDAVLHTLVYVLVTVSVSAFIALWLALTLQGEA